MPAKPLPRILAWSYSRLADYLKCPYYAFLRHVQRIKELDNPAQDGGRRTHDAIAHYLTVEVGKGKLKQLPSVPESARNFSIEMGELRTKKPKVEQDWAFDKNWNPCSWFGPQAWLRIKMDAYYLEEKKLKGGMVETTVIVIDHKTGKKWPDHAKQARLYALGAMLTFPDACKIIVKYWYLDLGEETAEEFAGNAVEKLKQEWANASRPMLSDTLFEATPNRFCGWCHFRKSNGGPCIHA